jgi:hypothetical protein
MLQGAPIVENIKEQVKVAMVKVELQPWQPPFSSQYVPIIHMPPRPYQTNKKKPLFQKALCQAKLQLQTL